MTGTFSKIEFFLVRFLFAETVQPTKDKGGVVNLFAFKHCHSEILFYLKHDYSVTTKIEV